MTQANSDPKISSPPSPVEIDPEELFTQWAAKDLEAEEYVVEDTNSRVSMRRHPSVLLFIFVLSSFLMIKTWPAMEALIYKDDFIECGKVLDRALKKKDKHHTFKHLQKCELEGIIQHINIFAIGAQENPDEQDMFEKNRGVSYISKMSGDDVFAILPAHLKWVEGHRLTNGSLFGLEFKARGLMIQPEEESNYKHLERELRVNFHIPLDQKIWFFDLTYSPWDHKMPLVTFVLSPLITITSLVGLIFAWRRRKHQQEEDRLDAEYWASLNEDQEIFSEGDSP